MSFIGYGMGSAWQSIAHGVAVAGYVIALVVVMMAAVAAFAPGCAKPGPGASALTAAELRLLPLLSTHLSFPEIAEDLFLSRHSTARALAAGATQDEVAGVLLTIAPMAGLGRVVSAAPKVATALEYDIEAALEEPDDH